MMASHQSLDSPDYYTMARIAILPIQQAVAAAMLGTMRLRMVPFNPGLVQGDFVPKQVQPQASRMTWPITCRTTLILLQSHRASAQPHVHSLMMNESLIN
jgi:hypothetical protein